MNLPLAVARPSPLEDEERRERERNQGFCEVPGNGVYAPHRHVFPKKNPCTILTSQLSWSRETRR